MSIATEITRLQGNRDTIRDQLVTWGVARPTDTLANLATTISGIPKQTVNYTLDATTKTADVLSNTSYTIPAGYHDGTGRVNIQVESKEVTPSATAQTITPSAGRVLSTVTVAPIPSQQSAVTQVLDLTTRSVTIPAGYYSSASIVSISPQALTITPQVAATAGTVTYTPSAGEVYGVITVNKVVSQSKTAVLQIDDGVTRSDTIEPDEGKVLSSVVVPRIKTESQETTAGTSAKTVTPSEAGKYLTQVTVLPTPTETKTVNWTYVDVANGITSDTYTPSSGKYFSAFTVNRVDNKYQDISGVTASASDVLITKKFVASNGVLTDGTMPNNGTVSQTLTTTTQSYTIPAGYHDGSGTVSIFPELIEVDPADTAQTVTPTDATKVISQVNISPITYSAAPVVTLSYGTLSASTAKGRYQAGSDNITLSSTGLTGKAEHVLAGYKVIGLNSLGTAADSLTGTMANNGAGGTYTLDATQVNNEYTNLSKTFAAGYWSSANTVSIFPATATITPGLTAQTLTPVPGSVYTKVEVAAIPVTNLTNSIISGQAVIESEAGQATDYKWVTTVDIPAGYHNAQTLTKDFSSIFPALDPAASAPQMLSGYQAYDKDGQVITGTMANNSAGSTVTLTAGSPSHTFAAGYWSSANTAQIITEQVEQAASPDQALLITPSSGKVLSQVTIPKIQAGALTAGSGSVFVTGNNSLTLGTAVSTAPTSGYYLTAAGSGTVNVGTAGWVKTAVSQTSNTQTQYYPIATASLVLDVTAPSGVSPVEVGFNHIVKVSAGYYHEDRYLSAGVATGSATTPTDTISVNVGTPAWDDTNSTFKTTASGSKSITPLVVAGYVDKGTAGIISATGSRDLGVVTVGADISSDVAKVTPVIAKASVPSGVVDVSNGAITTAAPASGKYVAVSAAAVSRTVTVTPKVTGAGYGTTGHYNGPSSAPTVDAGTNASGTYYIPVASGSATTPTETISVNVGTPAWDSTNNNFKTTASGSRSITPIVVIGHVSAGTAGTISATGSKNLDVVTVGADVSSSADKVTPVIAKASVPSGVVDVSNGAITTTAPKSGNYVAVSAAAIARTVTITPKVTGAGYGTTGHYNGPASNPTVDAGSNASGTYYVPVAAGSATTPTTTVSVTVGTPAWDNDNSTFKVTASGSKSITPIVVTGYVATGTAGTISATGSKPLGVVTVGADLSDGNVGKVKPVIAKASVPSGVVDVSNGAITTQAPSSGNYIAVSAAAIARTVTATPKVTGAGYGTTGHYNGPVSNPTIDAGSDASGTYYVPVASGTATTPTTTVSVTVGSPAWDNDNNAFKVTASGSKSITPTVTAGYIQANGGTAGTVSASGSKPLGVVTVGADLSDGNVAKVTPEIVKTSVPDGVINAANGAATKTEPGADTVAVAVYAAAIPRTVTVTPKVTGAGYGTTDHYNGPSSAPTVDAGSNASGTYYVPIKKGTITNGATLPSGGSSTDIAYNTYLKVDSGYYANAVYYKATAAAGTLSAADSAAITAYNYPTSGTATEWGFKPTLTYNSTSEKFDYGGSKAVTVRGHAKVTKNGYLTSSNNTYSDVTVTVKAEESLDKVVLGASASGTAKVTPTISKQSVPEGVTDAGSGGTILTADNPPTTGVYLAVKSGASANTLTLNPSVSTAGYGTTSQYGTVAAANRQVSVGANASAVTYIPIKTASPVFDGGAVTASAANNAGLTLAAAYQDASHTDVDPGTGLAFTASGSRAAVLYNGAVSGWVSKADDTQALGTGSGSKKYYISAITLASGKSLTLTNQGTLTVPAASKGTVNITTNKTTSNNTNTYSGTVKINAYNNASTPTLVEETVVSGGKWVPKTVAAADTVYYGAVSASAGEITNNTTLGSATSSGSLNFGKAIKIKAGYYASDLYYTNGVTDNDTGSIVLSATNLSGSATAGYYSGGVSASIASTGLTAAAADIRKNKVVISAVSGAAAKVTGSMEDVTPTFQGGASHASGNATIATANGRAIGTDAAGLTLSQTTTDPGSGIYITTGGSISHYRDAVTYKDAKTGYLSVTAGTTASDQTAASSSDMGALTYYVTKLTLPKAKSITVATAANSTTDNSTLTISNGAYRNVTVTNSGSVSVTSGGASAGTLTVKAYDGSTIDSSFITVVENGKWKKPTVNAADTYYGKVVVGSGSAKTPATTITTNPTISWDSSANKIKATYTGSQSITPTVSAGYVASGTAGTVSTTGTKSVTVDSLDSNFKAANIAKGATIFGVAGTYTSDGTATASDIISGKTAYVNGSKITGSLANVASTTVSNVFTVYQEFTANSAVTSGTSIASAPTAGSIRVTGGIAATGGIKGSQVYNAVWNDLADAIPVDETCELEYGYCYCFDGKKYYKSSKYLDDGIIGIHSDTAGFVMGTKGTCKEMQVAVAGFVLAYVDKEYLPGTLLTCTENGYLTEINKQDKLENPEKIVASFWKPETRESWGSEERQVQVNGRMWVKVR